MNDTFHFYPMGDFIMSHLNAKSISLGLLVAAMFCVAEKRAEAGTPPIKIKLDPHVSLTNVRLDAVISIDVKVGPFKRFRKDIRLSAINIKRKGKVVTVRRKVGPVKLTFKVGVSGKYLVGDVRAKVGPLKLPKIKIRKRIIR